MIVTIRINEEQMRENLEELQTLLDKIYEIENFLRSLLTKKVCIYFYKGESVAAWWEGFQYSCSHYAPKLIPRKVKDVGERQEYGKEYASFKEIVEFVQSLPVLIERLEGYIAVPEFEMPKV